MANECCSRIVLGQEFKMAEKMLQNDDNALAHYGVLGMKWGIRRYQPYPSGKRGKFIGDKRKSQGETTKGDATKQAIKSVGKKVSGQVRRSVKKVSNRKNSAKQKETETREELRRKTLESNDPQTIVKGLHTLSDKEVKAKLDRLQYEKAIKDMVPEKNAGRAELKRMLRTAVKDQIVKPVINEAAGKVGKQAKSVLFGKVAKATGTKKENVEKAAEAVKQAVVNSTAKTPKNTNSENTPQQTTPTEQSTFETYSRANWTAEGKNRVRGSFDRMPMSTDYNSLTRENWTKEGKAKVSGTMKIRKGYAQRNWTYHSSIEEGAVADYLVHYGVKGMKWGKRKARPDALEETSDAERLITNNMAPLYRNTSAIADAFNRNRIKKQRVLSREVRSNAYFDRAKRYVGAAVKRLQKGDIRTAISHGKTAVDSFFRGFDIKFGKGN